jgi:hypothetical protein
VVFRRLIAPETERWNEGERDWAFVKDPCQDIALWESRTERLLPDGYRRFMLAFNGGRVYPRLFRYNVPLDLYPSAEPVTLVDPFYSWARVEEYWRGSVYSRAMPENMLVIGGDPGGLEILLSVRPDNYGQIFCWVDGSHSDDTHENDRIWFQAASFEGFLDSLYDEADGSDYENWHVPAYDKLAKPFLF